MCPRWGERRLSRLHPVLAELRQHHEAPGQTDPEPEKPDSGGGIGTMLIVLLAALAMGTWMS